MTAKNPPAFPCAWSGEEGLTMRDYFAAAALQGQLSVQSLDSGYVTKHNINTLASICYQLAEAMLEARGETK